MAGSDGSWSVRANYWRGDRALGGHLSLSQGALSFSPHRMEKALGGNTDFNCALTDVLRLASAPRSWRVPRRRLIVTTRDGTDAYFVVPKLDRVIGQLGEEIRTAGGQADIVMDSSDADPQSAPENRPDDSPAMNWIQSGWWHVFGLTFWAAWLIALIAGSRNRVGLVVVGTLIVFSIWRAWAGFRRAARIKAARRRR